MGAREKLNTAYLNGSLFLAAVAGLLAQSWLVFGAALAVLLSLNLCRREIRPARRNGRDRELR